MKKKLVQLIDECDTISFDIFDTLIFRNVYEPTDLFKILDNYAKEKYNILDFFNIRIESEKESRIGKNNFESNFDEIYEVILKKIEKKNIVVDLKEKELELEMQFCVENPFMKEIFEHCKKKNKKIVLISDMYLRKSFLLKLLNKIGYQDIELYVSCEVRKNKGSSELFDYVYNKKKFNKDSWLHVGDNIHSDYNVPLEFGIKAFHYPKVSQFTDLIPSSVMESILLAIQCNYLYNGMNLDYWDIFGIKNVSLIYFGFTKWLYDLTKDQDNLYFLARDGYIPNKVYAIFNSDKKVFTRYLYCSRKSIQIPSLLLERKDKMINCLTQEVLDYNEMPLREYLEKSQVDLKNIDNNLIKNFGFNDLNDMVTSENGTSAKKLVARLYDNIKENLDTDKKLVLRYLEQEGMMDFKKLNVMDIGWGGSIQEAISRLLDKEVIGYYFGTIDLQKIDSFSNMFGYYFDLDNPKKNKEKVFSNIMMYELIFSAPHGTTTGYKEENGKLVPIIVDNVYYNDIVEKFQNAALSIIYKYFEYISYFDYLDKDFCLKNYQNFLENPNYEDLRNFSYLSNDFILGSDRQFAYVNTFSMQEIRDNPYKFCEKVNKSLWKNTFYIEDSSHLEKDYLEASRIYNRNQYLESFLKPFQCAKIYLDFGYGFLEDNIIFIPYEYDNGFLKFNLKIDNDIKNLRIDPVEGVKIRIKNLIIDTDQGSAQVKIPHKNYLLGKRNKCIYINSKDPKIILKNVENLSWISFSAIIELI